MTRNETEPALSKLHAENGYAHHQAFIATDGADEDGALRYAFVATRGRAEA